MDAGRRIRTLRVALGLRQKELAKKAGISQPALSQIESGATKVLKGPTILAIAKILDADPEWINTGKNAPVAPQQLSVPESEIIAIFRDLPAAQQQVLMSTARALLESVPVKQPTRVRPFATKTHP